ncbi:serine (or cysteine) peptidase inhibitor, clade H, member 2 [Alosa sapidissima]|uniref:serine (or cysteine) peptidase inhibitor, clade H, member 2 n=1 Tax=Alosa sapidissima TaxID=34773 RepID=UPI001C0A2F63|nr:serine (or cysteine) peptidase inhibitor, clade H, member 2 [Alosa sapidissima]
MLPAASGPVPFSLLLVLLLGVGLPKADASPQQLQQGAPSAGLGHHASWSIGLRLYRALRTGSGDDAQKTNALFSPLMLAASLDALGEASKGATAGQIRELLKPSGQKRAVAATTADFPQALKSTLEANNTAYSLHGASALFTKQAAGPDQNFLKKARSASRLDHVPLATAGGRQSDSAALRAWVLGATGGVMVDHQPSQEPQAQSGALILGNALRFKGLWDRGFAESSEDLRNFLGVKYTRVPMMHRSGVYRHYEDVENMVQVLEVGLWGGQSSMLLLLPFHVEGLERLDKLLTLEQLQRWHSKLTTTSIAMSLPKVNLTSALNLQAALSSLGLADAWDQGKADFSGLGGSKGKLHLGGVMHWASLELAPHSGHKEGEDEEEEEEVERPKLFYADHSFIVMVTDKPTGALLLIGAVDTAEGRSLHDEL